MNILVADDDKMSQVLIRKHLEKWGYACDTADDGAAACELFQKDRHRLVITDWMMPEMDGVELVRKIRELEGDQYTYVILLTAKHETEDLVEGMEAGADDFLTKPFRPEELRVRVRAGQRVIELEQTLAEKNRLLSLRNDELAAANERMKRDLDAAARIQQAFLPKNLPQFPEVEFAWRFRPCDELAGDMLNIIQLDERRVAAFVLDVAGHGVPAALLSVSVNRYLAASGRRGEPSINVLSACQAATQLNDRFSDSTGRFITMVYGVLDLSNRRFDYVTAGHPGPLYLPRRGDATIPRTDGVPIGADDDVEYIQRTFQLAAGDRLYLYSDGVVEAVNAEGAQFSSQRMTELLVGRRAVPLDQSVAELVEAAHTWSHQQRLDDDVSVLGLEMR